MTPELHTLFQRLTLVREAVAIHLTGLQRALAEADTLAAQLAAALDHDGGDAL